MHALLLCIQLLASLPTDIAHFTKLSKELRKPDLHPSEEIVAEIRERTREIVEGEVPDYGTRPLKKTVTAFVNDALHLQLREEQIVDAASTPLNGLSEARVFFIHNEKGALQYVVKAFPNPHGQAGGFMPELSSLASLAERDLKFVKTVKPLAVAKCQGKEKKYGLLLQTAAAGRRCDQFLEAIFAYSPSDPQRQEALRVAKRMCEAVGLGLSEFHGLSQEQRIVLARDGFFHAKIQLEHLLQPDVQMRLQDRVSEKSLKELIDERVKAVFDRRRYYSHGDAGPANIFYDPVAHKITLIDLARVHLWIDRHGKPLSSSVYDLYHFRKKLCSLCKKQLSWQELHELLDALHDGYVKNGLLKPDEPFYRALVSLCQGGNDPKELDFIQKLLKKK